VTVDKDQLEAKVKDMYRHVAQEPHGQFHFELGEQVALRVGYDPDRLQTVPPESVESFAGVGYFSTSQASRSARRLSTWVADREWTRSTRRTSSVRLAGS